jgi:hypothetical protein
MEKRYHMLFKPELVEKILAGEKTQTRRAANQGEALSRHKDGGVGVRRLNDHYRWVAGHTYAVQPGRGKHGVARIEITAIRYCARASDISESDAHAEGFASADEFREVYARINGIDALDKPCWALTFMKVNPDETSLLSP